MNLLLKAENKRKEAIKKAYRTLVLIFLFTTIYSILKYNILDDVPFSEIPTFILNKSVAFALIIIMLAICYCKVTKRKAEFETFLKTLNPLVIIHVLLSVSLLSQEYYPKLFYEHKLTLLGNLSVMFGVLTVAYIFYSKQKPKNMVIYLLVSFHLFFIGINGWFDISKWNNLMPPITLICFLIIVLMIMMNLRQIIKGR